MDEKSNQSLSLLQTTRDLQALLENDELMHLSDPNAAFRSADNYYLSYEDWVGMPEDDGKNLYVWNKDNLFKIASVSNDWSGVYDKVYPGNLVLNQLKAIDRTPLNADTWDNLKGQALLYRGKSFLLGAFIWTLAYDPETAKTDLGLPLRLDPNFNKKSVRSSVQETYDQIISDLTTAAGLLPVTPLHLFRPSKPAAYAWLARTYLSMRRYDSALVYANRCLELRNTLMDYNNDESIDPSASYRFARFNDEVIMGSAMGSFSKGFSSARVKIDTLLYRSYDSNDLRKSLFFRQNSNGSFRFAGSYANDYSGFDGVATDEMYLIRAECLARAGKTMEAMDCLNTLLVKRWKTGTFKPFAAGTADEALDIILTERRKELVYRGLRWSDIKRLNKEGANITLTRNLNGEIYTLPPNDPRYALAIPERVIKLSGMPQNPR